MNFYADICIMDVEYLYWYLYCGTAKYWTWTLDFQENVTIWKETRLFFCSSAFICKWGVLVIGFNVLSGTQDHLRVTVGES